MIIIQCLFYSISYVGIKGSTNYDFLIKIIII
jgi:hypothetical protein